MRILIVTHYFWPETFRINDLASELQKRGHEIVVLTPMPNYPQGRRFAGYGVFRPRKEVYQEISIFRVPLITRGQRKSSLRLALSYLSAALSAMILGPIYCRGKFDCVFVFQPSPMTTAIPSIILKTIKRASLMLWVQDLWPESLSATGFVKSRCVLKVVERLVRFIYGHSNRILVQSKGFTERITALGGAPDKIAYLPNWAEALYQPVAVEDSAPEHKLMPKGFKVLFAGNIGVAQDFPTILQAVHELQNHQDIQWIILGDGSERSFVESEVKKLGLSDCMHLLGRFPVGDMPRFFALADVLLVVLKRDPIFALTIPGKVQSYLACGKPVIAALDGEGARIVNEAKAGLACPAEDPRALARAVLDMKHLTEQERKEMGRRGREYYERHFDRLVLISKLESWMKELCPKSSR